MTRLGLMSILVLAIGGCNISQAADGAACIQDSDCISDLCVTELPDTPPIPGGLCTSECDSVLAVGDDGCAQGVTTCRLHLPTGLEMCLLDCAEIDLDPCRPGWECGLLPDRNGMLSGACIPIE